MRLVTARALQFIGRIVSVHGSRRDAAGNAATRRSHETRAVTCPDPTNSAVGHRGALYGASLSVTVALLRRLRMPSHHDCVARWILAGARAQTIKLRPCPAKFYNEEYPPEFRPLPRNRS